MKTTVLSFSYLVLQPTLLKNWTSDVFIAIPRIFCGLLLTLSFGSDKFGLPWYSTLNLGFFEVAAWFPKDVAEYGGLFALFPIFFAWMGAFSEAVGGLFLALGFKTRVASFLIICTMLVAIFMQKWNQGLWSMLPAMGFLWVGIYNLILGSGRIGLDYLISKNLKKQ